MIFPQGQKSCRTFWKQDITKTKLETFYNSGDGFTKCPETQNQNNWQKKRKLIISELIIITTKHWVLSSWNAAFYLPLFLTIPVHSCSCPTKPGNLTFLHTLMPPNVYSLVPPACVTTASSLLAPPLSVKKLPVFLVRDGISFLDIPLDRSCLCGSTWRTLCLSMQGYFLITCFISPGLQSRGTEPSRCSLFSPRHLTLPRAPYPARNLSNITSEPVSSYTLWGLKAVMTSLVLRS